MGIGKYKSVNLISCYRDRISGDRSYFLNGIGDLLIVIALINCREVCEASAPIVCGIERKYLAIHSHTISIELYSYAICSLAVLIVIIVPYFLNRYINV